MDLSGSTALVTGAASGLGLETATQLAARGVAVIGLDLAAGIEKLGDGVPDGLRLVAADVTSEDDVLAALALVSDEAAPLRVVVNCAGIAPGVRTVSSKGPHPLDVFRKTIEVNLIGTFNVLRLAAQHMFEHTPVLDEDGTRGVIVNTASVAAFEGQIGQAAYAASKGGVHALTITTARDLAKYGIRVNTIAPGIMDTPMLAAMSDEVRASLFTDVPYPHRLGRPDEYAKLVLAIADHDYLNGETIRMDGALRMGPA
jgi:NAD(P)-dependent dehydrogenase (short-subunit alcohol dehydrogenase family)